MVTSGWELGESPHEWATLQEDSITQTSGSIHTYTHHLTRAHMHAHTRTRSCVTGCDTGWLYAHHLWVEAHLLVLLPVAILTLLTAVVGIPAAIVLGLLAAVRTLGRADGSHMQVTGKSHTHHMLTQCFFLVSAIARDTACSTSLALLCSSSLLNSASFDSHSS